MSGISQQPILGSHHSSNDRSGSTPSTNATAHRTVSFRDPAGCLAAADGRILRFVKTEACEELISFIETATAKQLVAQGSLVSTQVLDKADAETARHIVFPEEHANAHEFGLTIEHERIPFPSFPYEWPPEMLHAAGKLTLEIAESVLTEGFGLKDASPYNILFRGPKPVFIDLLSFERRDPLDPTWLPAAQFSRTFLRPLLVNREFGIGLNQVMVTHRDGLYPEDVASMLSRTRMLSPAFLTLVSLPAFFSTRRWSQNPAIYKKRHARTEEQASFVLNRLIRSLRRQLEKLGRQETRHSRWTDYMESVHHTEKYFDLKPEIVRGLLQQSGARSVLDVGCNTGFYSLMAAKTGARVVAIDSDPAVVGQVWRAATAENVEVLPLVVDLARPTPAIGWRNQESASFLQRASGAFEGVLMLAVIHHMLVRERIPLDDIFQLASELSTRDLIIEYVGPGDPLFKSLTRGNDHLYTYLTREHFESVAKRSFDFIESHRVGESERWVYLMRKKGVA